jgi:hypothetical protein
MPGGYRCLPAACCICLGIGGRVDLGRGGSALEFVHGCNRNWCSGFPHTRPLSLSPCRSSRTLSDHTLHLDWGYIALPPPQLVPATGSQLFLKCSCPWLGSFARFSVWFADGSGKWINWWWRILQLPISYTGIWSIVLHWPISISGGYEILHLLVLRCWLYQLSLRVTDNFHALVVTSWCLSS